MFCATATESHSCAKNRLEHPAQELSGGLNVLKIWRMNRPLLTPDLTAEAFTAWYWLKKELQDFCSAQNWPTGGSKQDLKARVLAGLSGQPLPDTASKAAKGAMPDSLTPQTVIGPGWRLNAALRGFFVAHTSPAFRFNQALRELFKNPQGQTLAQALAVTEAALSRAQPRFSDNSSSISTSATILRSTRTPPTPRRC
jgi:hypothetical protein